MNRITFAKSYASLASGADFVLIVAPKSRLTRGRLRAVLGDDSLAKLATELANSTSPGDLGATSSTLTGGTPKRLGIGVLPDSGSRHNSPARAESVRRVVSGVASQFGEKAGVVLILDKAEHQIPCTNAAGRALPRFSLKKSSKSNTGRVQILCVDRSGQPVAMTRDARETVEASRRAAELVDTPPTTMNPTAMARAATAMVKGLKHVKTIQIRGDALLTAKLGGIHAVGRTAVEAPRLVVMTYAPPRAPKGHVALVGKGITYDTGGLHVKMRGFMEGMKCDMGGAAAMLGAFRVLAATGVRRKVSLLLCLAENAIGPNSYKPDDVLQMHSGLTVEINNTDAEGRLVLADGVSYAARVLGADTIIDAATLTGAQMVATGVCHSSIVSSDAALERIAVESGRRSGDLAHAMPFAPEFYKLEFKSPVADMRNSVKNRGNAQVSCAAQFIYWHIEDTDARWCHIDLAGPAFRDDRGTGYGVALVAEMVRSLPET